MQQWHLVLSPEEEARSDKQKGLLHVNMMLGKTGHGVQTSFLVAFIQLYKLFLPESERTLFSFLVTCEMHF